METKMVDKSHTKSLEVALARAANLSNRHADAVRAAGRAFETVFGVEVPEESYELSGGNSQNQVGSLFNNFVNHGENMSETDTVSGLVQTMKKLMEEK
jgi:hypothetical protein